MSNEASPLPFLALVECLKNIERSGWVRKGLPAPESVCDHMYRVAIMCRMVSGFDEETRAKAECMALIHDMGEAVIGDITPFDGISREEKHLREEMALKFLACTVRDFNPRFADLILDYWYEYEAGESRTSLLVRQMDKLECMDQALIYEERSGGDLSEFMALKAQVTLPELTPWLEVVLKKHENLKLRKTADIVVVFVIGGPGVGKGTQCVRAAKEFGFCHISVGDLLRSEAKSPTSPYKDFIPESIKKSVLLPPQLTTMLLKLEMGREQAEGTRRFLLDGFPRSIVQVTDFASKICDRNFTISLDCSEEKMQARLKLRAESSVRIDDNPDTVLRRLQTFQENNAPVIEYLQTRRSVYHVDSSRSIDEVYCSVRSSIQDILKEKEINRH